MTISLWRRTGAELLGAYALVTAGCGAIMVNTMTGAVTLVGIALTFGLTITVMIAAAGHISGGHFNPAVTLAFAVARHFRWRDVPFYVAGQLVGATLGALTLRLLFGTVANLGTTLPHGSALQSVSIETILTAVLMFVIVSVATDTRAVGELAALAIGATIALDILWAGPISGASMNPARSFGPALVSGVWNDQWIYWVGPLVGACIGALLYQLLRRTSAERNAPAHVPSPDQDRQGHDQESVAPTGTQG